MQAVLIIRDLPTDGLSASQTFYGRHINEAVELLDQGANEALAIVLPVAGPDHDDWRRTLARDLARAHAPKRVNVVGGVTGVERNAIIAYLEGEPGVTGQYLAAHE